MEERETTADQSCQPSYEAKLLLATHPVHSTATHPFPSHTLQPAGFATHPVTSFFAQSNGVV